VRSCAGAACLLTRRNVHSEPNNCGGGGPGFSAELENMAAVSVQATGGGDVFQSYLLHEIGHILGFSHEFDNPSFVDSCDDSPTLLTYDGFILTPPDYQSILAATYCGNRPYISRADRLGLSITYHDGMTEDVHFSNAFEMGDGGYVGFPTAQASHRWLAEGAEREAFAASPIIGLPILSWQLDLGSPTQVTSFDPFPVPVGVHTLQARAFDFRNRLHTATGVIEVNASKATAIVVALL
jgi:hypothetical protein